MDATDRAPSRPVHGHPRRRGHGAYRARATKATGTTRAAPGLCWSGRLKRRARCVRHLLQPVGAGARGVRTSDPISPDFFFPAQGPAAHAYDPWLRIADSPVGFTFQRDLRPLTCSISASASSGSLGPREASAALCRVTRLVLITGRPQPASPDTMCPTRPIRSSATSRSQVGGPAPAAQPAACSRSAREGPVGAGARWAKSEDDGGVLPKRRDPVTRRTAWTARPSSAVLASTCGTPLGQASWDVPYDDARAGALGVLLSDWQVSGVATFQSGRPFTVSLLQEIDNSNTGRANLGFGYNDRPNVVGDPALADPSAERWFDTNAFMFPAYGTFGNSGRNTVDGPGYQNVSLALMKRLPLGARSKLQLRLEAFNLFNHTNFNQPDNFLGSPTFGQILSAQSPRRFQLGAKVIF